MSLYNMLNGMTPAVFFVLPMLDKHPEDYPRFRDCFLGDDEHPEYNKGHIHVYTRVGGPNRNTGYGEEVMETHPLFVTSFDDSRDNTYASYIFKVPGKWRADYDKFRDRGTPGAQHFSSAMQLKVREMWPELKTKFDMLWCPKEDKEDREKETISAIKDVLNNLVKSKGKQ